MARKIKLDPKEELELEDIIGSLMNEPKVQKMKQYIQHGDVSTYEHCIRVARAAYVIDKKLGGRCDKRVLLTSALLHDFYLYDWHDEDGGHHNLHGYIHSERASRMARRHFGRLIDERTIAAIRSHMWPLNLTKIPRSREAWVVCLADKYCSTEETLRFRKSKRM